MRLRLIYACTLLFFSITAYAEYDYLDEEGYSIPPDLSNPLIATSSEEILKFGEPWSDQKEEDRAEALCQRAGQGKLLRYKIEKIDGALIGTKASVTDSNSNKQKYPHKNGTFRHRVYSQIICTGAKAAPCIVPQKNISPQAIGLLQAAKPAVAQAIAQAPQPVVQQQIGNKFGQTDPNTTVRFNKDAAGALVYTEHQGKTYVLLGEEKHGPDAGKWCMMLGKADHQGESYAAAAARELEEETGGLVKVPPKALAKMNYSVQTDPNKHNPTVAFKQIYTFSVKIPFQRAQDFRDASAAQEANGNHSFAEMSDYAWVPLNDITTSAQTGNAIFTAKTPSGVKKNIELRTIALKILQSADADGTLAQLK